MIPGRGSRFFQSLISCLSVSVILKAKNLLLRFSSYVCLLTALEAHFVPFESTGDALLGRVYWFAAFRALGVVCGFERHCARLTYPETKYQQLSFKPILVTLRSELSSGDLVKRWSMTTVAVYKTRNSFLHRASTHFTFKGYYHKFLHQHKTTYSLSIEF